VNGDDNAVELVSSEKSELLAAIDVAAVRIGFLPMLSVLRSLLYAARLSLRSLATLELEILALRYRLQVLSTAWGHWRTAVRDGRHGSDTRDLPQPSLPRARAAPCAGRSILPVDLVPGSIRDDLPIGAAERIFGSDRETLDTAKDTPTGSCASSRPYQLSRSTFLSDCAAMRTVRMENCRYSGSWSRRHVLDQLDRRRSQSPSENR